MELSVVDRCVWDRRGDFLGRRTILGSAVYIEILSNENDGI
jgi:hypothetical protein